MRHMLASIATDMIWEIVFCQPSHFIDIPDFGHPFPMSFEGALGTTHWNSRFPWLMKIPGLVPQSLIVWSWPTMRSNLEWRAAIKAQVDKILDPRHKDAFDNSPDRTLVHQLTDPKIPADVRRPKESSLRTSISLAPAWALLCGP